MLQHAGLAAPIPEVVDSVESMIEEVALALRRQWGRFADGAGEQWTWPTCADGPPTRTEALAVEALLSVLDDVARDGLQSVRTAPPIVLPLQAIRTAHRAVWQAASARVRLVGGEHELSWQALDRIAEALVEERCRLEAASGDVRPSASGKLEVVKAVLDAQRRVRPAELGYDLGRRHLALVVSGDAARTFVALLGREVSSAALVVEPEPPELCWVWLTCDDRPSRRRLLDSTLSRLANETQVEVAVGLAASGIEGFRSSHGQAQRAHALRSATADSVARYADLALESLVLHDGDPEAAQRFVKQELGPIDPAAARDRELLETVVSYLDSGQSATSAAAALGVHDQTVANRVRRFESLLGRSVASRSAELHLAARLSLVSEVWAP